MVNLICTSYNKTEHGLVLRNNWIEPVGHPDKIMDYINKWKLPDDFPYPSNNSISRILVGQMEIENVEIHVRIIRF